MLVKRLQLAQNNSFDVLKTFEEACLALLEPIAADPDLSSQRIDILLQSLHGLLAVFNFPHILRFEALQRRSQLPNLSDDLAQHRRIVRLAPLLNLRVSKPLHLLVDVFKGAAALGF